MRTILLILISACSHPQLAGTPDGSTGGDGASPDGGTPVTSRCPTITVDPDIAQQLPAATVNVDMPVMAGTTISVHAGDDLQAAIDGAMLGDTIVLDAGATFTGAFELPSKPGDGWIVIRTSAELAPGVRVTPAMAASFARIVGSLHVQPGAHGYRLIGLEVTSAAYVNTLVDLSSAGELAHDIILDRVYLHGSPDGGRRGVALNSATSAVIDSYLAGFREMGADSQAIAGWTGPGPYLVANNYLEGASENLMFGGGDPSIQGLVPSDIEVCGNHLAKDLAWRNGGWVVKNLFELKNARRVVVAGNVMEYNWLDGQVGFAVLFTPRNQDGGAPWSGVADVTFAYNIVRHTGSGLNMGASDDLHTSIPLERVVVHDNLFDDVDGAQWGGGGRMWQFLYGGGGGSAIKIAHNTTTSAGNALTLGDTASYGAHFVFADNIVPHGAYGVFGSGEAEGKAALDHYLISYVFATNALFGGGVPAAYPPGNYFPPTRDDVGFTANFSLATTSPYAGKASDGRDLGADITALTAATANAAP